MSDLNKLQRMRRILKDEDPTDCSPLPVFPSPDLKSVSLSRKFTPSTDNERAGHKRISAARVNPTKRVGSPVDMLLQQKQEISQLRNTIKFMSHEIERLQSTLVKSAYSEESAEDKTPIPFDVSRVLLLIGDQRLKYPLYKSSMTIGRGPENDIQVANEFMSRVHARILNDKNGASIEDLNSRNGLIVNSKKIKCPQQLCNGDLVSLGKMQFKFIDLAEERVAEEMDS
jgi:pSer/pThr/pTyr-binding forkhead associated (FHA) protein